MKQKKLFIIVPLLLAVGVFGYWYILHPEVLAAAEQRVLIVWDGDFLLQRFSQVDGWRLLPLELLAQFFYHRFIGALLIALLALVVWRISYVVVKMMASRWKYAAVTASIIALIPAILFSQLPYRMVNGTSEEMTCDYLLRKGQWQQLVEFGNTQKPTSLACQNAIKLAQCQIGNMPKSELYDAMLESNHAMTNETSARIMSEFYMQLGLVNLSQRATFEAMEANRSGAKSARSLKRLTETALINGQSELALKYIRILEQTLFYHSWACEMRPFAEHPELVDRHPVLGILHRQYIQSHDQFFY